MATPENYDDIGSLILKFQSSLDEMKKMNQHVHDLHDLLLRVNDTMNDTEAYMEHLFKQQVPDLKKTVSILTNAEAKFDKFNYDAQQKLTGLSQKPLVETQEAEPGVTEKWQEKLQTFKGKVEQRELDESEHKNNRIEDLQDLVSQMEALTEEFHTFKKQTEEREGILTRENNELKERVLKLENEGTCFNALK